MTSSGCRLVPCSPYPHLGAREAPVQGERCRGPGRVQGFELLQGDRGADRRGGG